MTWVIGIPSPFGYSVLISDVEATIKFENGQVNHHDMLQKIYPMGNFAMAGFSGDIENGFHFLQRLREFMNDPVKGREWIPDQLAREWGERAKAIYQGLSPHKKTAFSMLIAMIDPTQTNGIPNQPRTFVAKLSAPEFTYHPSRIIDPISIGSGNNKQEYLDALKKVSEDPSQLMRMEIGNAYGYASILGVVLSYDVFRNPHPGVSKNLQMACITNQGYQILPLNFSADIGLPHEQKIEMPELVTNWFDFDRKIKEIYGSGFSWAEATAQG